MHVMMSPTGSIRSSVPQEGLPVSSHFEKSREAFMYIDDTLKTYSTMIANAVAVTNPGTFSFCSSLNLDGCLPLLFLSPLLDLSHCFSALVGSLFRGSLACLQLDAVLRCHKRWESRLLRYAFELTRVREGLAKL